MTQLEPVGELDGEDRRSRATRIAARVRDAIINGELAPGERLTELRLADEHKVSRIPVREALRTLETEGFVTITPNRGAVVSHVGTDEAADLIEVREAIEVLIIRRAVSRCTDDDVAELRAIIARAQEAIADRRFDRLPRLNTAFHDRIAEISGNVIAKRVGAQLREKIEWAYAADVEERAGRSWADHTALVDALAQRDQRLATKLVRRHVDETGAARRRLGHFEAMQAAALRDR
ncbi:MAG: GntR family transcriptional regulator [Acidimicrobiia bacterium]